jgi:hypothetical protein
MLEFSQAIRIQTLEKKVKFLEERNQLMNELLTQPHSHPEVIQETSKEVICGNRSSRRDRRHQ